MFRRTIETLRHKNWVSLISIWESAFDFEAVSKVVPSSDIVKPVVCGDGDKNSLKLTCW